MIRMFYPRLSSLDDRLDKAVEEYKKSILIGLEIQSDR